MKIFTVLFLTLLSFAAHAQNYSIEVNSGNHDDIISSYHDAENNQLIAMDKSGFVVVWDLRNFSIRLKFQLPPESAFGDTKRQQLGKYEIEDQIDAAKYLGTLPYVDKANIGHWGWSYGGFMSALAI